MMKLAKDPKAFEKYAEMQQISQTQKDYLEKKRKLSQVADSRKNMRIDMRPKVVARVMTKELFLIVISIGCCACK